MPKKHQIPAPMEWARIGDSDVDSLTEVHEVELPEGWSMRLVRRTRLCKDAPWVMELDDGVGFRVIFTKQLTAKTLHAAKRQARKAVDIYLDNIARAVARLLP